MPDEPMVSVGVLSYNQAAYLPAALDSILQQQGVSFEVVFADDASADDSVQIARKMLRASGIPYTIIASTVNEGTTNNTNKILRACRGRYVCLVSSDDVLLPGKLAAQSARLSDDSDVNLVYHDVEVFQDQPDGHRMRWSSLYRPREGGVRQLLRHGCFPCLVGVMYRRDRMPKQLPTSIAWAADWLLAIQTVGAGRIRYDPACLARYRRHSSNTSKSMRVKADPFLTLAHVEAHMPSLLRHVPAARGLLHLAEAYGHAQAGRKREASWHARHALRLRWSWSVRRFVFLVAMACGINPLRVPMVARRQRARTV